MLTFWALVVSFIFILSKFFIPVVEEFFNGPFLFLAPIIIFSLLGLLLFLLTFREKPEGPLKIFLLLTGGSAFLFFIFILLHNLIYALFIYFFGENFWEKIGLGDEPLFFILAIFVCPAAFLIGIIGSIILFVKKRRIV